MPLVQLQPHPFTVIPSHPSLSTERSRPDPKQFVATALREAVELLHSIPSTFKTDPKPRASPPSQAKVNLLRGWRNSDKEKPEFWVARQSEHVNASEKGTASWSEFEAGLRTNHAEHEMEYTPSVSGVERLLEWSGEDIGEVEVDDITYKDVVFESKRYPSMLQELSLTSMTSQYDNAFFPPFCPDLSTQLHLPHYLRRIQFSHPIRAANPIERLHHRPGTPELRPIFHPLRNTSKNHLVGATTSCLRQLCQRRASVASTHRTQLHRMDNGNDFRRRRLNSPMGSTQLDARRGSTCCCS